MTTEQRDARRAAQRAAYQAEPETFRARSRANHRVKTPEQQDHDRERLRLYKHTPDGKQARTSYERSVRSEVIDGYGGRCRCCRNSYRPHLTIDHVNGDGAQSRREADQRTQVYAIRRALRAGQCLLAFQVLCMNCNLAKHWLGACGCQQP